MLAWLESGHRHRSKVDFAYDRTRKLAASEKEQVIEFLRDATKGMGGQTKQSDSAATDEANGGGLDSAASLGGPAARRGGQGGAKGRSNG
ncbi:putative uncharacterized protein [Mycobacterium sp. PO1]|nr:putative uncharacterized protein [Mycobacterium sp. PO1]GFM26714.1 putative uncharacterized protein [Mycobacterium sp. PO2]